MSDEDSRGFEGSTDAPYVPWDGYLHSGVRCTEDEANRFRMLLRHGQPAFFVSDNDMLRAQRNREQALEEIDQLATGKYGLRDLGYIRDLGDGEVCKDRWGLQNDGEFVAVAKVPDGWEPVEDPNSSEAPRSLYEAHGMLVDLAFGGTELGDAYETVRAVIDKVREALDVLESPSPLEEPTDVMELVAHLDEEAQGEFEGWLTETELRIELLKAAQEGKVRVAGIVNGEPSFSITDEGAAHVEGLLRDEDPRSRSSSRDEGE